MKEIVLPSGRKIKVEKFDNSNILIVFSDVVEHKLVVRNSLTPQEVDKYINDYLYGYTDQNTGEHIPGYFELIKEKKKEDGGNEWWK